MFSASRAHEGVEEKASTDELALPTFKKKAAGALTLASNQKLNTVPYIYIVFLYSRLALFLC